MNNKIKMSIKAALRKYPRYQDNLTDLMPSNLIMRTQLIQIAAIVYAIESAIEEATPEMVQYIERRYFEKKKRDISQIAFELSISESTLKRWDKEFVDLVIKHINLIVFG